MKQFRMTDRKDPSRKKTTPKSSPSDSAFDKWLNRGLHELFDDVMKEAVPPEMLKLLNPDPKDQSAVENKQNRGISGERKEDTEKK